MSSNTKKALLDQWKLSANETPDSAQLLLKVEQDLKAWIDSEERLLQSVRARAVSKMEERSTIMVLDARIKEIGEIRKAVYG